MTPTICKYLIKEGLCGPIILEEVQKAVSVSEVGKRQAKMVFYQTSLKLDAHDS